MQQGLELSKHCIVQNVWDNNDQQWYSEETNAPRHSEFYCMACGKNLHDTDLRTHCGSAKHLNKISYQSQSTAREGPPTKMRHSVMIPPPPPALTPRTRALPQFPEAVVPVTRVPWRSRSPVARKRQISEQPVMTSSKAKPQNPPFSWTRNQAPFPFPPPPPRHTDMQEGIMDSTMESNPSLPLPIPFEHDAEEEPEHAEHSKPVNFVPASSSSQQVLVETPIATTAVEPDNMVNRKDKPSQKIQVVHVRGPRRAAKRSKENPATPTSSLPSTAVPTFVVPGSFQVPSTPVPPGWMLVPAQGMQPAMMPAMSTSHQWADHSTGHPVFMASSPTFQNGPSMSGPMPNYFIVGQQGSNGHFAQPPVQYMPQQLRRMPEHIMFAPSQGQYMLMG